MGEECILVTGGAGFVGSYVVEGLIQRGKSVLILDDLRDKKGGLGYINPNAGVIKGDITDRNLYERLDSYNINGVYHLAAQTSGEDSTKNPEKDILTNSLGTWMIGNYCKERKIPRLIYTSTSAVYGSTKEDTVNETTLIKPDSVYGVSKYAGELFLNQLLKNSDTKHTIFRLTNNYGPGENLNYMKKGMVSIFCSNTWRNEPIEVRGTLDRYRDFLFIEDTTEALLDSYENEKTFNELYVLSSGKRTTVGDLVKKIIKQSGKGEDYPVIISKGTPGDTFGFHADISKIKRDMNWEPRHSLDEGLKKYFDWINKVPVVEDISNYHPFLLK